MSSSTNNATDSSLFVSSNPTPQTPQQPCWWRRGFSATSSLISGTAYYASRPVAWALNPIGDGLASGVVSGGQRELTAMLQPNGPAAEQVRTLLTDALIKRPPQELYRLKEILDIVLIRSEPLTPELVIQAHQCIALLNQETLQKLVPDLSVQGKEVMERMRLMFQGLVPDKSVVSTISSAPVDISAHKEDLERLSQVIHVMLERHQGSLVQAMAFLQEALVGNGSGLIGQAIDILTSKLLDTSQSSLTRVEKKLSQLFSESPDSLRGMLDESERRVVDAALALLRQKTTASTHAPQQGLKEEEKALIKQVIGIGKNKIALRTNAALQVLLNQLNASTGLLHALKNGLSIAEQKALLRGQTVLERKLDPTDGIAKPWTQEECTLLAQTLELIAQKYITSHEDSIKEAMDLIESKLQGNEGVLSTLLNPLEEASRRLLEQAKSDLRTNWVSVGNTPQKLAYHQFKEAHHRILEAIRFLQPELQKKHTSVLREAQGIVKSCLSADESKIIELKRLDPRERSSLEEINRLIGEELAGTADLSVNRRTMIQSQLNATLKIVQTKNATLESALRATTLEQLSDKLKREMAALSKLESGLTDPAAKVLLPLLKTAQKKLIAEEGPLASMEARIDSNTHDIITQAIDLLNAKLFEIGGPIDGFRRTLVDEGGILDKALRLLNTGLLDSERGVLTQATAYLKAELTQVASDLSTQLLDEENGAFAKAINLLNEKLQAKDGLLATLDTKLNHEEHGILAKAATVLDKKLNERGAFLDRFNARLNATAHPKISETLIKAKELEDLSLKNGAASEQRQVATKLLLGIQEILSQYTTIFKELDLRDHDRDKLTNLKRELVHFVSNPIPTSAHIQGVLTEAIEVLHHHHHNQQGIAARTGEVLVDQLQKAIVQPEGLIDQFNDRINATAHPYLIKARKELADLQKTYEQSGSHTELLRLSQALAATLKQIDLNHAAVFAKSLLRFDDLEKIQSLQEQLTNFTGDASPSQGAMRDHFQRVGETLNHHCVTQAGIIARTTDNLAAQFSQTLLQPNGPLDQLSERLTGYADKFTDAVTKGLDPLLARFEKLPRTMYDDFMGRNPKSAGPIEEAPPVDQTEQVSIGSYLQKASEYLGQLLAEGASIASQKAVTSVAGSLLYALEGSLESIEGRENFDRPREMLKSLIAQVTRLQASGSVTELQSVIKSSFELFNTFKIYINGFRVPKIGTLGEPVENPENPFLSNISQLRTALQRSPPTNSDEEVDWKVKAQEEKEKFVDNTKKYLAIKIIYEQFCGLTPVSDHMYFTLMRDAARQEDPNSALKDAFFRKLQNANVGWFKRAIAHAAYFTFSHVLNRFIQKLSTTYLEEAFKFIDENKGDDFLMLKNMLINNFTRYLTILGGAYERVAHNPQPGNRLSEMLKSELDKPECNLGQSTSDLYANFAQEVINKCTGNRFISWLFKKFVGNEQSIVNAIVNQSVGSLMDINGYTHALNCVVVEQLQEALRIMEEGYAQAQRDGTSVSQDAFSKHRKSELAGLVKNLFEILQKSKCQTKDELRDVVDGKSLTHNAVKLVDNLFIQDVIENVTNIMALTIGTLVKEDQLHKLTYKFTNLVNTVYEAGESYTLDEVNAKERELTELTDRILNLSILTAVEEKFDFTGTKEQQETNRQISDLKRKTEELTEAASRDLEALDRSPDLNSVESKTKLKTVLQEALAYQTECSEASFEAKGGQLNADNKEELKARYLAIARNSTPYIEQISKMSNAQKQIEEHAQLHPELQSMLQISQEITRRLCSNTPTLSDMSWARDQITILEHHLEQANRIRNQATLTEGLTASISELALSLNELHHSLAIIQFALEQGTETSLAAQIVREKQQSFGAFSLPATIRNNIELLKSQIRSLNDDNLSRRLFLQIEAIQNSTFQEQLENAFTEFKRLSLESLQQSDGQVHAKKERIRVKTTRIQELINGSHLLHTNYVQTHMQTMRESLAAAHRSIELMRRSYQSADARLLDAETKALALKNAIKTNIESTDLPGVAAQLSASIQILTEQEGSVFQRSTLTTEQRKALRQTQLFLNELQDQAFPDQDAEGREETITKFKENALRNLAGVLEILNIHRSEQSKHNAFKPVAYVNKALMDMNSFKNWATELVFGRVKDRVDGLMQFLRREDTYKFGLTNHMLLIPYLQHVRG